MALTDAQLRRISILLDGDLMEDDPRGIAGVLSDMSRIAAQVRAMIGSVVVVAIAEEPGYEIVEDLAGTHRDLPELEAMNAVQNARTRLVSLINELEILLTR